MNKTSSSGIINKLPTTYSYVVNFEPKKKNSLRTLKQKMSTQTFSNKQTLLNVLQNYKSNNLQTKVPQKKSKSQESKGLINEKLSINQQQSTLEHDKNNYQKVCQFKLNMASFDNSDDIKIVYQIQLDEIK